MKSALFWAQNFWNARSYKPVILEQCDNNLRMKTDSEVVFDAPLSDVHAKFTRWGRMLITINNSTYCIIGTPGYSSHSKEQLAELKEAAAASARSNNGGAMVGVGQAVNTASGMAGATIGQVAGAGLQVAGGVEAAAGQYAAQAVIESWHVLLAEKGVSMDYKPANAYTWFLICLAIVFVVGLTVAIVFFK